MSSDWGSALRARQAALLELLVSNVSSLPPDDPNWRTAVDFVAYHTRRHAFPDTDPWQVARLYDSLEGAKSRNNSQTCHGGPAP
jgi:hypothetical protein